MTQQHAIDQATHNRMRIRLFAALRALGWIPAGPMRGGDAHPPGNGEDQDEELLSQFVRGDEDAFRELFDRHNTEMVRRASLCLPHHSLGDIENAVQAAWIALLGDASRLVREKFVPIEARLFQVLEALCFDARKGGRDRHG